MISVYVSCEVNLSSADKPNHDGHLEMLQAASSFFYLTIHRLKLHVVFPLLNSFNNLFTNDL